MKETQIEELIQECESKINSNNFAKYLNIEGKFNFETILATEAGINNLVESLKALDTLNINTLLLAGDRIKSLADTIETTINEIEKLENKIEKYELELRNVKDVVLQVEQKEHVVQIRNKNQVDICDSLESLIYQISYPENESIFLLEANFNDEKCIPLIDSAAKRLQDTINADIHPAFSYMTAVQQQIEHLNNVKTRFIQRFTDHLTLTIQHLLSEYSESLVNVIYGESITLPGHDVIHNSLLYLYPILDWMRQNESKSYEYLVKFYSANFKGLYDKEFKTFFECAKDKIASSKQATANNQQGSDPKKRQSNLIAQSDSTRNSSMSGSVADLPDSSSGKSSEVSYSEWEEFDSCVEKILTAIDPVCLSEQRFCTQFFSLSTNAPAESASHQSFNINSPSPSSLSQNSQISNLLQSSSSQRNSKSYGSNLNNPSTITLRSLMDDLFTLLESEFTEFARHYDSLDGLYSMYLLVRLSQHVLSAQDTGSFLAKTYGNILIHVKRNFDRFMNNQLMTIKEAKAPKRPKCGVLNVVKRFERFALQVESAFKNTQSRRTEIDRWYLILVPELFATIENIEHHKTPQEMVKLENYNYLDNALRSLKVQCLETQRKEANLRYKAALNDYVARYFGRPLERLNIFFEGVQAKVAQGVKEDEIGYQLAFSKQELRKVINSVTLKEVKKGLEEMFKKVEKHACEPETNLIQVIWRSMQEEFLSQHKNIQDMINRCYPHANLTLTFKVDDVLRVFSEIAQSH